MALPKLHHTLYSHHLTGLNKTIRYRPFTNAEQKTLLLAKEAKGTADETRTVVDAVRQVVEACTLGKIDVNKLATFDLQDLFLRIRAKSVGEEMIVRYRYDYTEDGKRLSNFVDVKINVDDIKIEVDADHTNKIQLDDNIGIVMKYPTFEMIEALSHNSVDDAEVVKACIDYIYDENEVYTLADASKADIDAFYDDIDTRGTLNIKKFFATMPKIAHEVQVEVLPGKFETVRFEGLESFFT